MCGQRLFDIRPRPSSVRRPHGKRTLTDFFFLSVAVRLPSDEQRCFMDQLLISIAKHGLPPPARAARMTLATSPDRLQGALAAGILGCGKAILGAADKAGQLLIRIRQEDSGDRSVKEPARQAAQEIRSSRSTLTCLGRRPHRPRDPRAERILALASQKGVAGIHCEIARKLTSAVEQVWGRQLTLSVSMAIAAVLLDLDFPERMIKAIPSLARAAALLGHIAEEHQAPTGVLMAAKAEEAITYVPRDQAQ